MTDTRLDRWKLPRTLLLSVTGDDEEVLGLAKRKWDLRQNDEENRTLSAWIEGARELILDTSGDKPVFHIVGYHLDSATFELKVSADFQILINGETQEEWDEEIVYIIGLAVPNEIPVYSNTDEEAPLLAKYYRELMTHGMLAPDGEGKKVRLKWRRSPGEKLDSVSYLDELKHIQSHPPAELILIRDAVRRELASRDEAGRALASLRFAISELESLLASTKRNEHALQRCLEANPVLFGPDYQRVIPKHRLGAEYEMDYALVRVSGLVDLAEIESSTLRLFKRNGDPTSDLVHAEQQVMNWLAWMETNEAYARQKLPNIMRPMGYVVIGRTSTLNAADQRRLQLRNALLAGGLQVLTYDDLLGRALNLLRLLLGESAPTSG